MILRVLGRCGPYPRPGEACSGYLLSHEGVHLILDMGSGTVSRLRMIYPDLEPDAIVLSHLHFDHMGNRNRLGIFCLIRALKSTAFRTGCA